MSISERLQMVIKMNGMTNSTFADEIGVQRSSISHVLAGRNKPSIDFIQKILDTFPKVDANWLVTGKKVGKTLDASSKPLQSEPPSQTSEELFKNRTQTEASTVPFKKDLNRPSNRSVKKVIVFYMDGTYEEIGHTN